eukprot:TRINITY_DN7726_c0_g1_i6.p1 TRINITY_DN7726_c0_g1~~TRINITY_DN7726_c0_g1_i6.p1  ORF type:complete len:679 (+),score=161.81 TRINITY_DN7726_c0_g1_i6:93-2039(+)
MEDFQSLLESLSFPDLVSFIILQYNDPNADNDELDESFDYFLFVASGGSDPRGNRYSLVENEKEALSDPQLLQIIMNQVKISYEPEIFLEALNILAAVEGLEEAITASGALKDIVVAMSKDSRNSRSQSFGCRIVSNLCANKNVRNFIGGTKVVTKIIEALKNHNKDSRIVIDCLRAFINLSYQSPRNKRRLVVEKALDSTLDAIDNHKNDPQILSLGLAALRNMATGDLDEMVKHKLIFSVLVCMSGHLAFRDIQLHGTWTLINLCRKSPGIKEYLIERDAHADVMTMIEEYPADRNIQIAGFTLTWLLSKQAKNRIEMARLGWIDMILLTLQGHKKDPDVLYLAIKNTFFLSFTSSSFGNHLAREICSHICKTMQTHVKNLKIQKIGVLCFIRYTKHKAFLDILCQEALSVVSTTCNQHPELSSLCGLVIESIFMKDKENVPENTVQQLKDQLRTKEDMVLALMSKLESLEKQLGSSSMVNSSSTNAIVISETTASKLSNVPTKAQRKKDKVTKEFQEREPKTSKDILKQPKDGRLAKEGKEVKLVKEPKETKESKKSREKEHSNESKDPLEMKEHKETKEGREVKDPCEIREVKENKESKEIKEIKVYKEIKESKDAESLAKETKKKDPPKPTLSSSSALPTRLE